MTQDRGKYAHLIDAETWAFIDHTNDWYPPDTVDYTIEQQREIYNRMCRQFFAGYPRCVKATDSHTEGAGHRIPIRTYQRFGSGSTVHVVYYHGGGFVVGGLESHDDVCAEICDRTGFGVTSVDYRLSPEHIYPKDFEDALAGFRHVAGFAQGSILVVGDSAGGNLAAAVSHATRADALRPSGQVLIYPGLGSRFDQGSFIDHAEAPMLTTRDIDFYKTLRTGADVGVLQQPTCAPLNDTDFSGLPPTVIFGAECDPLADDGKDYCDALVAAGSKARFVNERGLVHGYLRARHSVGRARDSFDRIIEAIAGLGATGSGEPAD